MSAATVSLGMRQKAWFVEGCSSPAKNCPSPFAFKRLGFAITKKLISETHVYRTKCGIVTFISWFLSLQ